LHLFVKEKNVFVIPHFAVGFIFQGDMEKNMETHERIGKCVLCGFHKKHQSTLGFWK